MDNGLEVFVPYWGSLFLICDANAYRMEIESFRPLLGFFISNQNSYHKPTWNVCFRPLLGFFISNLYEIF